MKSIWHVGREFQGLAESGGVKDVIRQLSVTQTRLGYRVACIIPYYKCVLDQSSVSRTNIILKVPITRHHKKEHWEIIHVHTIRIEGVDVYLLSSNRTREKRNIYTYTAEDQKENPYKVKGTGHWDAHEMNLLLQRGAAELALAMDSIPDIVHCHDGHSSFLPAICREIPRYQKRFASTGFVVTIHNAGNGYHQDIHHEEEAVSLTGLPIEVLSQGQIGSNFDPLLLAAVYAQVNTVSPEYAKELLDGIHAGNDGGLGEWYRTKGYTLSGITNGIDPSPYDPRDRVCSGLPFAYDPQSGDLTGKVQNRNHLLSWIENNRSLYDSIIHGSLTFPSKTPLFGFIGRITRQKGISVLVETLQSICRQNQSPQFLIVGLGEKELEESLKQIAISGELGGRICYLQGYFPELSKLFYASVDVIILPSQFEPCGLTDLFGLMMGAIPVVHETGGLKKIVNGRTGFSYSPNTPAILHSKLNEVYGDFLHKPQHLHELRRNGFYLASEVLTWEHVFEAEYLPLYERSLAGKPCSTLN